MRLFLLFLLFSLPAFAGEPSVQKLCAALPNHIPDQSVHFIPGVDVHGKPVAPADLAQPLEPLSYPIKVPLDLDLAERYGIDLPEGIDLDTDVVEVEIHEDGRVIYNGQDLSNDRTFICGTPDEPLIEYMPPIPTQEDMDTIDGEAF